MSPFALKLILMERSLTQRSSRMRGLGTQPFLPSFTRNHYLRPTIRDGNSYYTLWCLAAGDSTAFEVTVHADASIGSLKKLGFDSEDSVSLPWLHTMEFPQSRAPTNSSSLLVSSNEVIALEPEDTLDERVRNLGSDFSRFSTKLSVSRPVSMAFVQQPPRTELHILVGLPLRSKSPLLLHLLFSRGS
jgi:hypothetical protein